MATTKIRLKDIKHIFTCPKCKKERYLTYSQIWNIKKDKSTGHCQGCREGGSLIGLKKGHGWNKGKLMTWHKPAFKRNDSRMMGANNPSWKGGITPINTKIRNSPEYILWRKAIFERDNYTCIWCKQYSGSLVADHIKPFALFPELRFALDNGRTLCVICHRKTSTYGGRYKHGYTTKD